jgi:CheY-like chemotaxis protein
MSIKHALVVDDSKSAQFALKKQLETHGLAVSLADSGEAALEFLEHEIVDVIFMDHTMPGMDGLQALAAIKRNPRTAMIPVMMYTTKEGEVYVGQARALGGIGVLPKEVHPQVLFDMLLKLGLVEDKRIADSDDPDTPQRRSTDVPENGEPRAEPSTGIALPSLVSRILEDQSALRAEFRKERAGLAREVANEVVEAQRTGYQIVDSMDAPQSPPVSTMLIALTALFAGAALIFAILAWNVVRSNQPGAAAAASSAGEPSQSSDLAVALHTQQTHANARYLQAIDTLQWAMNQNASTPFEELAFDDARIEQVRALLEHLVALGFQGRVRIESHLGEFCLVGDEVEGYRLAPPDLPIESCSFVGHPLDNSRDVADRESVDFAQFIRSSPMVNHSGIVVELIAHDRTHSMNQIPPPSDANTAGQWNRVAERNNRLEFSLITNGS